MPVGGRRRAVLGQPGPQGLGVAVAKLVPGDGDRQWRAGLAPAGSLGPVGRVAVDQELGEELERGGHGPAALRGSEPGQVHGYRIPSATRRLDAGRSIALGELKVTSLRRQGRTGHEPNTAGSKTETTTPARKKPKFMAKPFQKERRPSASSSARISTATASAWARLTRVSSS